MTLALVIMSQSRPWSDRYLFLAFNAGATTDVEHVELFVRSYLPNSLEGRSARNVGKESIGLKRSVRVQAFTCSRSLAR